MPTLLGLVLYDRLKAATVVVVSHGADDRKFCIPPLKLVPRDGKLYQFETLEEAKQYYD